METFNFEIESPADVARELACTRVNLSTTTNLRLKEEPWGPALKNLYSQATNPIQSAAVSLLNAALTQNRLVFTMSRDKVMELVKGDDNIAPKKRGIYPNDWTTLLSLVTSKYLVQVQAFTPGKPGIYAVKNPSLKNYLISVCGIDETTQTEECQSFIGRKGEAKTVTVETLPTVEAVVSQIVTTEEFILNEKQQATVDQGIKEKVSEEWLLKYKRACTASHYRQIEEQAKEIERAKLIQAEETQALADGYADHREWLGVKVKAVMAGFDTVPAYLEHLRQKDLYERSDARKLERHLEAEKLTAEAEAKHAAFLKDCPSGNIADLDWLSLIKVDYGEPLN